MGLGVQGQGWMEETLHHYVYLTLDLSIMIGPERCKFASIHHRTI